MIQIFEKEREQSNKRKIIYILKIHLCPPFQIITHLNNPICNMAIAEHKDAINYTSILSSWMPKICNNFAGKVQCNIMTFCHVTYSSDIKYRFVREYGLEAQ